MRIAFSGGHGCGKTTCAKRLSEYLKIPYVTGNAKHLLTEDSDLSSVENILEFQFKILENKQFCEKNERDFVTDRSFVDLYTYMMAQLSCTDTSKIMQEIHGIYEDKENGITTLVFNEDSKLQKYIDLTGGCNLIKIFNAYKSRCLDYNRQYDYIFYLDDLIDSNNNNLTDSRSYNYFYNNLIHECIRMQYVGYPSLYDSFDKGYIRTSVIFINKRDPDERFQQIISYLV